METTEKLNMLQKLSEKDLTKKVLIPLFESNGMGFKNIHYTHKNLEFGKDVIYYKDDEFDRRINTAVQVKITKITTKDNDNIFRQISEAFGEKFNDSSDNKKKSIDKFVVLTSNEFLEDAKQSLSASLRGSNLDRDVSCIDGNQLVTLLEKHLPSAFWDEYDCCNRYFNAMKNDFEKIKDFSAIGQKEPVPLENIYVSLRLVEPEIHQELKISQEAESDLQKETQKQIEDERISKAKTFDIEKVINDYNKVIILGAPGSGKSTLLKYLALKNCKENIDQQETTSVPIPITLQEFSDSGKDLRGYIEDVFTGYQFPEAKEFVNKDLKEGKCKLLLDGFDELATKEKQDIITKHIHKFIEKYPKNQIIVTSRIAGYHDELKSFTKLELMKFDDNQIEQFVENWFGKNTEKSKSMLNAIKENEQIKALARNPLMVSIIAIIYEEDRKLPQRRAALYNRCVEVLLSKWDIQKKLKNIYQPDDKMFILKKLAFYAHSNNKKTLTEVEILDEVQKDLSWTKLKDEEAKPLLDEIWQRSYILRQISRDSYDFLHLSFQEYFTALELKEQEDGLSTVIKYLDDSWWEEPILLYVGITKNATALINRVKTEVPEDIFYSNLLLFGQCIADADFTDPSLRKEIINELWNLYKTTEFTSLREKAIKILGNIKPENIIDLLILDLKNKDEKIQASAINGLVHMESEKAIEPLIETFATSNEWMLKHQTIQALKNIRSDKTTEPLIKILKMSKNKNLKFAVAFALAEIKDEKAIEPLINILKTSKNKDLKFAVAFALAEIKNETTIDHFIEALNTSENDEIIVHSLLSLAKFDDERAIKSLIEVLTTSKKKIIQLVASLALHQIRREMTIDLLIKAFKTSNNFKVRIGIVETLERTRNERAIEPLIEAFNTSKSKKLRVSIIQAFGSIGSEEAIEFLTEKLTIYKDKNIQWNTAIALGKLGDKKAIKLLIEALTTAKEENIRSDAAYALGKIGDKKGIKPLIKALSTEKEAIVRLNVATSLGLIGDESTFEPLKNALKDEDEHFRNKVKDEAFVSLKKVSRKLNKRIIQ